MLWFSILTWKILFVSLEKEKENNQGVTTVIFTEYSAMEEFIRLVYFIKSKSKLNEFVLLIKSKKYTQVFKSCNLCLTRLKIIFRRWLMREQGECIINFITANHLYIMQLAGEQTRELVDLKKSQELNLS